MILGKGAKREPKANWIPIEFSKEGNKCRKKNLRKNNIKRRNKGVYIQLHLGTYSVGNPRSMIRSDSLQILEKGIEEIKEWIKKNQSKKDKRKSIDADIF